MSVRTRAAKLFVSAGSNLRNPVKRYGTLKRTFEGKAYVAKGSVSAASRRLAKAKAGSAVGLTYAGAAALAGGVATGGHKGYKAYKNRK